MAKKARKRSARGEGAAVGESRAETHDRDVVFREYFDAKQSEFLRTVVCDEVIEEHRQNPLGQHSEPLERLLHHFRRMPMADKYAIKRDSSASRFRIVALSGVRGTPPKVVEGPDFATVEDAYHAVFLLQIKDLMGT